MEAVESSRDVDDAGVAKVTSVCVSCGSEGLTRMLLTKIPHFNDIVIISFECKECGYRNNEVQNVSSLKDYGVKIVIKILKPEGLNNQIVLSNNSTTKFLEIDFEVPPIPQRAIITTIEGLIVDITENLDDHIKSISEAIVSNNELNIQLSTGEIKSATDYICVLSKIKDSLLSYRLGEESFTMQIDDPSGSSYVEKTETIVVSEEHYTRTDSELKGMGYATKEDVQALDLTKPLEDDNVGREGLAIAVDCPNCGLQGYNKICEVVVPGFGDCVIMAFTCENCGSKTNEIKPGGGYKDFGKKWTLTVDSVADLNRDVILSETGTVIIQHLDLEMMPGTIGAVFTSVEGLILKIAKNLEESHPFLIGDSALETERSFKDKIKQLTQLSNMEGIDKFTIIIDDPADHCFIGSIYQDDRKDEKLTSEIYKRTYEQDEELGLIGMVTEDY